MPATTIVYGIQGAGFAAGDSLTPEVARAVAEVASAIVRELAER